MNIILIGEPKIGKSTLLSKSINQINSPLIKFQGVISKEIRDENQIRQGFRAITSSGVNEIFAHKKEYLGFPNLIDINFDRSRIV